MIRIIAFFLTLCMISACHHREDQKTVSARVISPTMDTVYFDDKVPVLALVDDPVEVHTITLEIKIMPKDSSVFYIYEHDHQKEIKIDTTWHNRVDFDTEMQLFLVAYNHNNQVDTSLVKFYSKKNR